MQANQVEDNAGQAVPSGILGTFVVNIDSDSPIADLAAPTDGEVITDVVLNGRGYIDVTFLDLGSSGLDGATITDAAQEFGLVGAAAYGVVISGVPVLVPGTASTYRYTFTNEFKSGSVTVIFLEDAWRDNAGNPNEAELEYFTIVVGDNTAPTIAGLPDKSLLEDGPSGASATTSPSPHGLDITCADFGGSISAGGDTQADGTSYMLYDEWGGTWSDANKQPPLDPDGNPPGTGDDWMCWAATASNVLDWTQWGHIDGMLSATDMFGYFQDHWTDEGGNPWYAWDWWFDGTNNSPVDDPGVFQWAEVDVAHTGFYPTETFGDYFEYERSDSLAMSKVDDFLRSGEGVGLVLYRNNGHVITCWGLTHEDADTTAYTGVWVTDSDDDYTGLKYYEVALTNGKWYLQGYSGSDDWYITEVAALGRNTNVNDLWAYTADAETPDSELIFTVVGNTNPDYCAVSILSGRFLCIEPAPDWNGVADVTVEVSDGEFTDTDTFRITVGAVNDSPSFHRGVDQVVNGDAGPQVISEWATDISPGPPDEAGQTLTFQVTNDNNGLFAVQPAVSSDGTLTYMPGANDGEAIVTVVLKDSGGTADGGEDTSPPQTFTITVNPVPPTVTDILIGSTLWDASFLAELGGDGYSIPTGTDQLVTLPWTNIDQVKIAFSEDVNVSQGDLSVHGVSVPEYTVAGFIYDAGSHTATWTWTLSSPMAADKLLLALSDDVTDTAGNSLDGEWTDGSSTFPSGNGSEGGDFQFRLNVLPGDVNQSDKVTLADYVTVRSRNNAQPGEAGYDVLYDVNGSGKITLADYLGVRSRNNDELPTGEPVAPLAATATIAPMNEVVVTEAVVADTRRETPPEQAEVGVRPLPPTPADTRVGLGLLAASRRRLASESLTTSTWLETVDGEIAGPKLPAELIVAPQAGIEASAALFTADLLGPAMAATNAAPVSAGIPANDASPDAKGLEDSDLTVDLLLGLRPLDFGELRLL